MALNKQQKGEFNQWCASSVNCIEYFYPFNKLYTFYRFLKWHDVKKMLCVIKKNYHEGKELLVFLTLLRYNERGYFYPLNLKNGRHISLYTDTTVWVTTQSQTLQPTSVPSGTTAPRVATFPLLAHPERWPSIPEMSMWQTVRSVARDVTVRPTAPKMVSSKWWP